MQKILIRNPAGAPPQAPNLRTRHAWHPNPDQGPALTKAGSVHGSADT